MLKWSDLEGFLKSGDQALVGLFFVLEEEEGSEVETNMEKRIKHKEEYAWINNEWRREQLPDTKGEISKEIEEPAIGIDLGTNYSCVAILRRNNAEVMIDRFGNRLIPSCIAFADGDRLIGQSAVNQADRNPRNTVFGIKRLIGRRWGDQTVHDEIRLWPFRVIQGSGGRPMVVVEFEGNERNYTTEELSAMILSEMRTIAEHHTGRNVKNAVITVPAHFDDSQRTATKVAGHIAGLNVMRIINEPTAAALAYGLNNLGDFDDKRGKYILVFDLGGGTLDITIILIREGVVEVQCTEGDSHLGGQDFDNRLVEYMAGEFRRSHKLDIFSNPRALGRLRNECEKVKRLLSFHPTVTVAIDSVMAGIDFTIPMSRPKFEQLNEDLFERCKITLEKCIGHLKGATKDDIDEIVLVGGSTRIPKIQDMVKEFFDGKPVKNTINPDEAVACGAAILATKLAGSSNEQLNCLSLRDVTPLSLGVESRCGVMRVVIPKNTRIPTRKEQMFSTVFEDQTSVNVKVFQGERELTRDNHLLGHFVLDDIEPESGMVPKIHICFSIDEDGILTVTAEQRSRGLRNEMVMCSMDGRLTDAQIQMMVDDAKNYRLRDWMRSASLRAMDGITRNLGGLRLGEQDFFPG